MTTAALEVTRLSVRYGGVRALTDVSLTCTAGQAIGLIGPNGAGKTTLVDAVTGSTRYTGDVRVYGKSLNGLPSHRRVAAGLARTFQSLELFDDLTVAENLDVASPGRVGQSAISAALEPFGIVHLARRSPRELSNGHRKLVAVARAIVSRPKVLVLDEPAAGLDTHESLQFGSQLRRLLAENPELAILLIDHDMGLVMGHCDRIAVLQFGELIAEGTPEEIRTHPEVLGAYLGASETVPAPGSRFPMREES